MQISKGKPTAHSSQSDTRWNAPKAIHDAASIVTDAASIVTDHAVSTAKIIISAEERLRQRARSVLRVALATVFFAISGLISLGANVTTAFAKKAGSVKGHHGLRVKAHTRARLRFHHEGTSQMRGVASWYGKEFNKRRTASGVRFNTHAMMAAHRTLPFGTKVRVTNLVNHKSCIVEITDRGPYARGRIIDLSYAAAEKLGMAEAGVANVQLEILGNAGPSLTDNLAKAKSQPAFESIPSAGSDDEWMVDETTP
ncbi:MAG TPA: septal ring lytic transglycosylase RlpA family protein [Candidatus Kapabacteria bacterium]|nr:septal ring lytic transglycosylase RlpA family protein [Candidatus Kapabacteria bacterium]